MPTCHECGAGVSEGDWFCPECGADLDAAPEDGHESSGDRPPGEGGQIDVGRGAGDPDGIGWDETDGRDDRGWDGAVGDQSGGGRSSNDPSDQRSGGATDDRGATGHRGTSGEPPTAAAHGTEEADERLHGEDPFMFTFKYPVSNGWGPVLISGLLLVFSFLLFPMFLLAGYGFRVSRAAALGRETAPAFEDWGGLLVDGFRYFLVSAALAIPFYVLLGVVFVAAEQYPLVALLLFPVYVGFGYAMPAFVVAFVATDSMSAPFTSGIAIDYLTTVTYLKDWAIALAVSVVLSFVPVILVATLIGWIWGYAFYALAYAAYWGFAYYNAAQEGVVPPPRTERDGAAAGQNEWATPAAQD